VLAKEYSTLYVNIPFYFFQSVSPYHAEPDRELLLELSARLFGAEVGWLTLHHNARDAAKELFDNTFDLVDKVVKKAKDFDVSAIVMFV
jgi:hypothetical protein